MQGLLQNNILDGIMNEKIKKLAEQSGFYFYDLHDIDGQDLGETIESDDWESMERFAKLIIQECISIIEPTSHHKAYPYNYLGEAEGLELLEKQVYYIKKHFGIE